MKKINIHPSFTKKVFQMAIQKNGEELDLSTTEAQVDFMSGFIDSLEKEAHLNPSQALGFLKYITGIGFVEMLDKKASTEDEGRIIDELFDDIKSKIAEATSFEWTRPIASMQEMAESAGRRGAIRGGLNEVKKTVGLTPDTSGRQGFEMFSPLSSMTKIYGEAKGERLGASKVKGVTNAIGLGEGGIFSKLKDSGFLSHIAPAAIGALGGYLIPKMFGSDSNGLLNAGIGAAAGYGAKALWDSKDPKSWEKFKNQSLSFIGGANNQAK